ncbi:Type IV secretion system protein virB11 [Delftia tsuruhatensis]|uniref:ATPase, T2SS/T4P/T4SS family n=1 Tax=Delftia tsuruhatensis TaxID=180282 RepID=UPI001E6F5BB6|nr:ATPase, T2SS/T4P/T4SS family [Delftia tsuruhatensis]CAB5691681.1 Type IV secretion system protein virB11 [Delftia tsuruhatensis]CAC9676854.1 Type IV secretion system protein virB11 [Delftia tsuruhatensis]
MLYLDIQGPDGQQRTVTIEGTRCRIGRGADADLVLPGWTVHKEHAEVFVSNEQAFVRDLGTMFGTYVKDAKITTFGPLQPTEAIRIGPHRLLVRWSRQQGDPARHGETVVMPESASGAPPVAALAPQAPAVTERPPVAVALHAVPGAAGPRAAPSPGSGVRHHSSVQIDEQWLEYRRKIHEKLIESFDMRRTDVHRMSDAELRLHTEQAIREIFQQMPAGIPAHVDRDRLMQEVRDEAIGLGLLEPLLADPSVTEIMVNRVDEIFVEREGRLSRVPLAFSSEKAVMGVIERIVAPVGRRIDESSPLVDARLKDGSRFNAIIPPLALKGPSMTIRKFAKRKLEASDLVRFGSANEQMVEFLRVAVQQHKNIIVSGGTGSGKTTLLNILSNFIPVGERIVTIEDAAELQLPHEHLVSLESRPANAEGKGQIAIRELVKNSLRMRPDRIVVGECRGGEALDMLQAMNTGHDGSLTTAHANSPRDMLARLEVMVMMAGMDLPVTAIREQVASAVDLIVQQTRFACGSRKITRITEVTGVESGKIQLQDLFEFVETGFTPERKTAGYFTGCDSVPEFYEKLRQIGVEVDLEIFRKAA